MSGGGPIEEPIDDLPQDVDLGEPDLGPEGDPGDLGEPPAEPAWTQEEEEFARAVGWKSPDEWKGDPPKNGLADDPREFAPYKAAMTIFEKRMADEVDQKVGKFAEMMDRQTQRQREAERQTYEAKIAALEHGKRQAVEDGDMDRYDRLVEQGQRLQPPSEQDDLPPQPPIEARHPDIAWLKDPTLLHLGGTIIEGALATGRVPNADPHRPDTERAQIEYAERELRRLYPAAFTQSGQQRTRRAASPVHGGTGTAGRSAGGTEAFYSLDEGAQRAFKHYVKNGLMKDDKEGRAEFYKEVTEF